MTALASLFEDETVVYREGEGQAEGRVWELAARRGRAGAARRLDLVLGLLQAAEGAVLVCGDDPVADGGQPEGWAQLDEGVWALPDEPLDLGELLDWLADGNWLLVGFSDRARVCAPGVLDLFGQPDLALAQLRALGASWAVDVFHDDEPWRVALLG